ncbi:MAG TPA: fused MFS/spermidine synthase [Lacipirellulaceae bacterium]|nr:fused MFS/spermidine synthase [Lacipirellulaceae bacterium]
MSCTLATRRWLLRTIAAVAVLAAARPVRAQVDPTPDHFAGRLEFEGSSEFSHIRVRRRGNVRTLLFVRDSGEEVLESRINLKAPHVLQFEYLKHLFTSYLFRYPQQDVLIIGLGGGSMIHFLQHADPGVRIDAVEIDPLVVKLADEYFAVRSSDHVRLITADGLKFISEPSEAKTYDAIYLDAFLKPSAGTDATGVPLALRTQEFYKHLQSRLKPGGVVAFNINPHAAVQDDVKAISAAFPQTYQFALPRDQGLVVVGASDSARLSRTVLMDRAAALDATFSEALRFKEMARRLRD